MSQQNPFDPFGNQNHGCGHRNRDRQRNPYYSEPGDPSPPEQPPYDDGYGDDGGQPEAFRRPVRVVCQTHVYYDDGTSCTFTTPSLESFTFHPNVIHQFLGDYFQWMQYTSQAGFYCPRQHKSMVDQAFGNKEDKQATNQVLIMPTNVMITPSFMDNPNDSILTSVRYPGCELKFQMPILQGFDLGPPANWNARGTGNEGLPPGYNGF